MSLRKNKTVKIFILFVLFIAAEVSTAQYKEDVYYNISKNMEIFGEVYKEILANYVDNINSDKFFEAGINGMLSTLDPYTVYYNENDQSSLDLITAGKYGGIGITITAKDSLFIITDVMNGYEASRKGIRNGDILKEIDGTPLSAKTTEDIRKRVRGQVGTKLNLKIERDGEKIDFSLVREEIILKDISYSGFIKDSKNTAYIKIDRFGSNSDNEFINAIKTLKSQKEISSLIIDLRNNGGGFLNAAIGILNTLVEKNNLLLTTRGNKKDSEVKYFSKQEPLVGTDVPIVVLINSGTASASEITAGALQDLDRGVIVGTKSFGKGLVQNVRDLDYNTHIKITTARYFTPSGRWIQSKDYFLENKQGVFYNTNSFEKKEFFTLNGRTVSANGGITPDVEIKISGESDIHFALLLKDMFFKYSNHYLLNNPGIKIFKADEQIFSDFRNFIIQNGFDYLSPAEKKLNELRKIAEEKSINGKTETYIAELGNIINSHEESELENAKGEILRTIENEINKRIITEKEQIEAALDNDLQIQEAISIISDTARYRNILNMK
ncbi:MAG: S41 family peptidase [Ignavibacteria bacterium]|jgi:carboxyl-terminal processing protease|nr:S41 family peptidase [Ignavibacteria bacterium]